MSEILKTEDLTRTFGSLVAVNHVNFSVEEGEIRSVIGPNGAGKSTFMDLIINKTPCTSGKVFFRDEEITRVPPHEIARRGLGRCFQISKFFPELTVYENIQIPCINQDGKVFSIFKEARGAYRDRVEALLESVGLKEKLRETAGYLSYGDQRRLEIAITLACDPILLMLDEPSMGLAPILVEQIFEIILKLNQTGTTILLVEQNAQMALSIANRAYVLETGHIVKEGSADTLMHDDAVRKAYLG
jgi:ABC-type branched-subunit amino acid transport system ATPase component